jgi:hypothetical protein
MRGWQPLWFGYGVQCGAPMIKVLKSPSRFVVVMALLLGACTQLGGGGASPYRIARDADSSFDLTWLSTGQIILNETSGVFETLWSVTSRGAGLSQLRLPTHDSACRIISYLRPRRLPDGALGFLRWCDLSGPVDATQLSLVRYDVRSGSMQAIMQHPLGFNPDEFTWDPTFTRGFFSVTSSICAGIGGMTRNSVVNVSLSLPVAGLPHKLDEDLHSPGSADCTNEIKADLPAWSPDGARIAFLASPQAVGISGFGRLDQPWNLYLVRHDGARPSPMLQGLVDPRRLAWAPDSRRIAYAGSVVGKGSGIWIFDTATRSLRKIAAGDYASLAWSPDGAQLAAIRDIGSASEVPPSTEVLIMHVGRV